MSILFYLQLAIYVELEHGLECQNAGMDWAHKACVDCST